MNELNLLEWASPAVQVFSLRLTLALLHFLWQGIVIVVLAIALTRWVPHASAKMRYAINLTSLVIMAVCLPLNLGMVQVPEIWAIRGAGTPVVGLVDQSRASSTRFDVPAIDMNGNENGVVESSAAVQPLQPATSSAFAAHFPANRGELGWASETLTNAASYTTAFYMLGVLLMLIRLAAALWGGHRLRAVSVAITDSDLLAVIARQARAVGLTSVPAVAWCERLAVPMVVGIVRPLVLLPAWLATGLNAEQLDALICHELAHIRRFDLLVNLFQRLVESLLFFHPAVWIVSRRISSERELCCDDLVVQSGYESTRYAGALIRMAELYTTTSQAGRHRLRHIAALQATGEQRSELTRRVYRLLGASDTPKVGNLGWGAMMALLLVFAGGAVAAYQVERTAGTIGNTAVSEARSLDDAADEVPNKTASTVSDPHSDTEKDSAAKKDATVNGASKDQTVTAQDDSFAPSGKQSVEEEFKRNQQRDPFDEGAPPPTTAKKRDTLLDSRLRSLAIQARDTLNRMEREASRSEQLESLLARLHHPGPRDDTFDFLQKLAELEWAIEPEDSDVLSRLQEWVQEPSSYGKKYLETGRRYVALANDDFPFNWRVRRDYWIQLVTTIAASRVADDPAAIWRKRIAGISNPMHRAEARLAYLAVVSLNPAVELDLELLKPLYLKSEDPKVAMLRLGQIYAAAASRNHGGQEQLLTEMRQRLPALSKAENQRDQDVLFRSLGANVRYSLVSDVLREASPSLFVAYAEGTSLSRNEIAGQFLSKAIAVEFDDTTPYRAFLEVLDQVELSIWIDEELIAVNQKCKMKLSGTWKDVTQRLAAGLGWRFVEISDGIFYLGPGDKLKHTDPMLISSRRKLPIPGDIHPELDRAISTLEFRQQTRFIDVPLSEVAALLTETTSISIDVRVVDRKIVTSISQKIPVHLTLSLVCYQADAKWSIDDTGAVVIEPDPSSQREAHQRERREAQQFREELERQKAAAR